MARGSAQKRRPQTCVALLRGINLGSRNKVSMADLRALFGDLGYDDVATYVQSGNVIFTSPVTSTAEVSETLEEEIGKVLGLSVAVLMRTGAQIASVLAGNPFVDGAREPAKLHVTFLAGAPEDGRVRELEAKRFDPDELLVAGQEVYLHCPGGYGRTKLGNAYLEKQLGVAATTRNWKTVTSLAQLAGA